MICHKVRSGGNDRPCRDGQGLDAVAALHEGIHVVLVVKRNA